MFSIIAYLLLRVHFANRIWFPEMIKLMWHGTSRLAVRVISPCASCSMFELLPHAQITCSNIKSNVKRVSFVIQDTPAYSRIMLDAISLLNECMGI